MAAVSGRPLPPGIAAELRPADLDELELTGVVSDRSIAGALDEPDEDDVEFDGCRLSGTRITGGRIGRLAVSDCAFETCDLAGVDLSESRWDRVTLHQCRLAGCLTTGGFWRDITATDVRAERLEMRYATVRRAQFDGCSFVGADLTGTTLDNVVFARCDLSGARLDHLDVRRAHFAACDLTGALGVDALGGASVDAATLTTMGLAMASALRIRVV